MSEELTAALATLERAKTSGETERTERTRASAGRGIERAHSLVAARRRVRGRHAGVMRRARQLAGALASVG